MRKSLLAIAGAAALFCSPAFSAIDTYTAFLFGQNETPAPGDPDGVGVATVIIDNVANTVSWAIMAQNIALPLTGAHIHAGAYGVAGPVIVDFNNSLTGSNMFDADLAMIRGPVNATAFYVNLHNAAYPAGAIRGQLQYVGTAVAPIPEPGTYALMFTGLAAVGFMARRRRT
ncbi:MAG TPA: CHRD domain-containing protein [Rubrivivax sp.]|nr:CHRD domain-containing protein [Rubrivivax sp.]